MRGYCTFLFRYIMARSRMDSLDYEASRLKLNLENITKPPGCQSPIRLASMQMTNFTKQRDEENVEPMQVFATL